MSPIGALVRGVVAGIAGTVVMDAVWYVRYRRGGGQASPLEWEFGGIDNWEKASAPGRVGKRLAEGFLQRPLPPQDAALTNNIMHWGYGIGWGAIYGLVQGSLRRQGLALGPLFGITVWIADYLVLPPSGLYKPIWDYDLQTLYKDWSAHVAYGSATATVFRLLTHEVDVHARGRRRLNRRKRGEPRWANSSPATSLRGRLLRRSRQRRARTVWRPGLSSRASFYRAAGP
jgi:hypothetical protein